ncbi:hypothetical protein TI05_09115 [Achromatium sp. WMS3]|nr:hypothetical protein TI05_09115 [Achromatium sp. WMS3]
MKILLDECIDHRFRFELTEYEVKTVSYMGWKSLQNGESLKQAEKEFDVLITVDANLRFQQNFKHIDIALIVLCPYRNKLHYLTSITPQIKEALKTIEAGQIKIISQ